MQVTLFAPHHKVINEDLEARLASSGNITLALINVTGNKNTTGCDCSAPNLVANDRSYIQEVVKHELGETVQSDPTAGEQVMQILGTKHLHILFSCSRFRLDRARVGRQLVRMNGRLLANRVLEYHIRESSCCLPHS